jgi:arginyl-tRNA synthetase
MQRACSTSCAATTSIWISIWSWRRRAPTTTRCTTFSMRTPGSRACMRQLQERGVAHDAVRGAASYGRLTEPQEVQLIKRLASFPEVIQQCAVQRAPHTLVHYLRDLANDFHTYYSAHQFIVDDAPLRDARLNLALATQVVIRNGLDLLGVSAPDTM